METQDEVLGQEQKRTESRRDGTEKASPKHVPRIVIHVMRLQQRDEFLFEVAFLMVLFLRMYAITSFRRESLTLNAPYPSCHSKEDPIHFDEFSFTF